MRAVHYLLIIYAMINVISFSLYGIDKRRAKKNRWRIREATLMTVAALGGSVGSLLGMYTVRHKTKHLKFVLGIPVILVVQILVAAYFISR